MSNNDKIKHALPIKNKVIRLEDGSVMLVCTFALHIVPSQKFKDYTVKLLTDFEVKK